MPTKEDIRRKYGITEQDFDLLTTTEMPPAETLQREGTYVEKVGWWENFEVWLKKSIIGSTVCAVLLIGSVISSVESIEKYAPIVLASAQQAISYVNHYADYAADEAKGFLVRTTALPTQEDKQRPDLVLFATGSCVYPLPGKWWQS
jgi:hypothetical protein